MDQNITITLLGVTISILALGVSALTLWLSHLRKGQILMTKPTIFFFGWDDVGRSLPKIFMRSLLFSTANSGRVLENLYLLVRSPRRESIFGFWGHTDSSPTSLTRGSGLFIGKEGFLANHHFNPNSKTEVDEPFPAGTYEIEVVARQFGDTADRKLGRYTLHLDEQMAMQIKKGDGAIWTLNPKDHTYSAEISPRVKPTKIPLESVFS